MKKLLVAVGSEDLVVTLEYAFRREYELYSCRDGEAALELLDRIHPDILLIDLWLPKTDGLLVLQQAVRLPNIILALARSLSPYDAQCATDAGVDHILQIPCNINAIRSHLINMIRMEHMSKLPNPQDVTKDLLLKLNFSPGPDGFQQLRVGVPLFAQDRQQPLFKELYPSIAQLCGKDDPRQIDSSIHRVIKAAWNKRNTVLWDQYFPNYTTPPANKDFLNVMADLLENAMAHYADQ